MKETKKMIIFEPAMCCSTGVCGPSVNGELLKLSTVINNLAKNGVLVERYNLKNNPQIFLDNQKINEIMNSDGIDILPVTMVDGEVVKIKEYPTADEFMNLLEIPIDYLQSAPQKKSECCGGGSCN